MSESETGRRHHGRSQAPVDLVPFLFGVSNRRRLPGPVLVRLLGELGLTPAGARTVLARLRAQGGLAGDRRGRHTEYRLAGSVLTGYQRVARPREPQPPWDGVFHGVLYTVPERERAFRDALRRTALITGYGLLRAGLLVNPYDRWAALGAAVDKPPEGARVAPVRLSLLPDDARAATAEAWDLDRIAAAFRREEAGLRDALNRSAPPEPDAATLRAYVAAFRPATRTLLWDPGLPAELLPPDWPRPGLLDALGAVGRHFQPAAQAYLDGLLAPYEEAASPGQDPAG